MAVAWVRRALLVTAVGLLGMPDIVRAQAADAPRLVFETAAGNFTIVTFPQDAPRSVAHIVGLVTRGFYNGLRVHRAQPGFVVQFGDPQSRDLTQRERWGIGPAAGSGRPIGIAEISSKHKHGPGAVGLAHMGDPSKADSQIFVTLDRRSDLDRRYAVIGQVIEGADVPLRLTVGDLIGRAYVAER